MGSTSVGKSSPAEALVRSLKRHGRMTIKELQEALGVTRTAVRQQLSALEAKGLVERTIERRSVGRPSGLYSLSAEGNKLFAREYETLLLGVLDELQATEGESQRQSRSQGDEVQISDFSRFIPFIPSSSLTSVGWGSA